MPQAERTANIVALLKWLSGQKNGISRAALISYMKIEVTEMGATERTVLNYLRDCGHYGMIEEKKGRFMITPFGRKWLARHSH